MARRICIQLPDTQPLLSITMPGVGEVTNLRQLVLEGYNSCQDAQSFLQGLQPIFASLGMPLCILDCVSSITEIFTTSFPFVDPSAVPKMVESCKCLSSFTPFGFCGMLRGLVDGVLATVSCLEGLLNDIAAMESQASVLLQSTNADEVFAGQCLSDRADKLRTSVLEAFGPVSTIFESTQTLFQFVGVPFSSVGSLTGDTTEAVLASLAVIKDTLQTISDTINTVCP